jgi:hypothetical protein
MCAVVAGSVQATVVHDEDDDGDNGHVSMWVNGPRSGIYIEREERKNEKLSDRYLSLTCDE